MASASASLYRRFHLLLVVRLCYSSHMVPPGVLLAYSSRNVGSLGSLTFDTLSWCYFCMTGFTAHMHGCSALAQTSLFGEVCALCSKFQLIPA
eukprot:jgi/Botrbrau1/379/Bobra.110_2s0034.1